jgi:hypothetical protein
MLQWIQAYSSSLTVFVNFGMLLVWMVYLHLLLMAYRRQRHPKILINRGAGTGMKAHCLISNMSPEPIYVECVVCTVGTETGTYRAAITDVSELEQGEDVRSGTRQGPLNVAEYMDFGMFEHLAVRTARHGGADDPASVVVKSLDLVVVAAYGPEDSSVAAQRRFLVEVRNGRRDLVPASVSTTQLKSRRARRQADRYLAEFS